MNLKVKAPSDLPAGYIFEATVDGKNYNVTVPDGGVKANQEFDGEATEAKAKSSASSSGPTDW
eukprot:CAMPEP_0194143650 /NCGR_PEP_ID=MMETSP0152-20130528/12778_1 /TAXON_ID=1049557 /ORGANISM="Thalassiothrix antarctica, Strain L6-D1" /LENGTH=62 /DNA_ID=CAMNT_0038843153 /DNA_START=63 /DNA_END=248 /DNA_ORIENTATION=-